MNTPSECAVCFTAPLPPAELLRMPCCGVATSTLAYCQRCIETIVEMGIDGRIGRCPTCSGLFTIEQPFRIVAGGGIMAPCRVCMQTRPVGDPQQMVCEMCLLGARYYFRYECSGCHGVQRIPHPMWRYQETALELAMLGIAICLSRFLAVFSPSDFWAAVLVVACQFIGALVHA
jgi:hypothetical protein